MDIFVSSSLSLHFYNLSQLFEALATIRKYEDKDQGLTDTLRELKEVKDQLNHKNEYIKDLVNVINKLEELNSHQELQISSLR